jgi:hypothetical protein
VLPTAAHKNVYRKPHLKVGFFCCLAIPNNKEDIMASLIKALLRLKPAQGFGADLPRKARKRGVNLSLRRDRAIAKARRAEAKALKVVARATRQLKLAADTASARAEAAKRKDMLEAFLLAKAEEEKRKEQAEAERKEIALQKEKAKAEEEELKRQEQKRAAEQELARTQAQVQNLKKGLEALKKAKANKTTLVLKAEMLKRTEEQVQDLLNGLKAIEAARRLAATLIKRSEDFFRDVVVARPVRSGVVAGTVRK